MSGFPPGRFLSCGFEVVCAFTRGEAIETDADGAPQAFDCSLGGFSQQGLPLGKKRFDRIEVGAVGGRQSSVAPTASMSSPTFGRLWLERLSKRPMRS